MNDSTLNIVGESDQTICTGAAGAEGSSWMKVKSVLNKPFDSPIYDIFQYFEETGYQ